MRSLFSLLMLLSFLNASVVLENGIDKIDDFKLLYYNDTTASLNINEISKLDFNQTLSNRFAKGLVKGNSWFKFTLVNNSNSEDFFLNLSEMFMDTVNLYSIENGTILEKKNGLNISMIDKEIKDPYPTFKLHIEKNESKIFYVETITNQNTFGKFTLYLNVDSYIDNKIIVIGLYLFYLGGVFIVILLNIFLFSTLKERIYLLYSSYVLVSAIYMMSISGVVEYIFPDSVYLLEFASPLSLLLLMLFSIEILQTSIYTPKLHKIMIVLSALILIVTILIVVDAHTWFIPYLNFVPLIAFFILFTAIMALKNGSSSAKFYMIFMLLYVSSIIVIVTMVIGLIEYNKFTRYFFVVSSFFEISFFSLVLANRFHSTRIEKRLVEVSLEETKELASRDGLTSLYNRHYLASYSISVLNEARSKAQELCVIMLDIDHFKLVNDTYGHSVGDMILKNVADVFVSSTRESDRVVRYGGEEFLIILPNTKLENSQNIAEKIRRNIENMKTEYEEGKNLSVTISLGVTALKAEDSSLKSTISRADEALYASKVSGRNRVNVTYY